MQDQQLRKLCGDAARQIFLITPGDGGLSASTNAASRAPPPPPPPPPQSSASSSASTPAGTEELQRACDAVVRHAMTLHRLCRRAGGGGTVDIVSRGGPSSGGSSGGGGGGTASAAEEAVFCVCAAIIAIEPRLWAALVRRARLLRQHRPSLRFLPPVTVPPVLVAEVERFHGRSRHLVSSTARGVVGGGGGSGSGSGGGAQGGKTTAAAATDSSSNNSSGGDGGMPVRQAEAVAACFFWKIMTPTERVQRRAVLELLVEADAPAAKATPSSIPPPASTASRRAVTEGARGPTTTADVAEVAEGTGVAARPPPPPSSSAATAAAASGAGPRPSIRARPAPLVPPLPRSRTHSHLAALGSAAFYTDGLVDWAIGRAYGHDRAGQVSAATRRGRGEVSGGGADGARVAAATAASLASSITSDEDDDSEDSGGSEKGSRARSGSGSRDGDKTAAAATHAGPVAGKRRRLRPRDADDAAVLARLYAAALSSEAAAAAAAEDVSGDTEHDFGTRSGNSGAYAGATCGDAASLAAAVAGRRPSMFTADKGLGLVSLAASVTHVRDALHWGRLQALVRCPLLFRTRPWLTSGGSGEGAAATSNTVQLPHDRSSRGVDAGHRAGEALTAEAMRRLRGGLGLAVPESCPNAAVATSSASRCALDAFLRCSAAAASSASVLAPVRLRTAAPHPLLLPPPAGLVTEGFLWTRLLICGAWLLVYADGLSGETDGSAATHDVVERRPQRRYPRIQPTPAVRATVAYCVAVVREARAMSGGGGRASPSHTSALEADHHARAVCCPVCDELIREQQQQPALWWSTLAEDRAALRAQVRTVLENSGGGGDDGAENAVVAAALVADLAGEGRGRRFAPALLSGSESAPCRVAALQQRWAAHVMQPAPDRDADGGAGSQAPHRPQGTSSATPDPPRTETDGGAAQDGDAEAAGAVLWAALAQRVAAAAELSGFLSAHPPPTAGAAAASAAGGPRGSSSGRTRRRRTELGEDGDDDGGGHRPPRRGARDGTSSDDALEDDEAADADEDGQRRLARRRLGGGGGAASGKRPRGAAAHGSRQAMEAAEEWGRLLRRCGWVNAAAPSPAVPAADVDDLYTRWATSLFAPAAVPTAEQAATLRRRWSRYTLTDVLRKMVLGRGGDWARYARLLFGADVDTSIRGTARSAAGAAPVVPPPPPPPRAASLSLLGSGAEEEEEGQATADTPAAARASVPLCTTRDASVPRAVDALIQTAADEPGAPAPTASTPGKSMLPSIPLHVSPLSHRRLATRTVTAGHESDGEPTCAIAAAPASGTEAAAKTVRREEVCDAAVPSSRVSPARRAQLQAQQEALYALLRFRPRLPALREEDAVLECAACFSLFHQGCIAPVQRDVMAQAFLCHTCRLRWARPYAAPGGGFVHQEMEERRA